MNAILAQGNLKGRAVFLSQDHVGGVLHPVYRQSAGGVNSLSSCIAQDPLHVIFLPCLKDFHLVMEIKGRIECDRTNFLTHVIKEFSFFNQSTGKYARTAISQVPSKAQIPMRPLTDAGNR